MFFDIFVAGILAGDSDMSSDGQLIHIGLSTVFVDSFNEERWRLSHEYHGFAKIMRSEFFEKFPKQLAALYDFTKVGRVC